MVRYIPVTLSPRVLHGMSVDERKARLRQELPARYPDAHLDLPTGPDSYTEDLLGRIDADSDQERDEVARLSRPPARGAGLGAPRGS